MPMLSHKICDVDSSLHFELGCFCGEHVQLIKRRMLDIYIYISLQKKIGYFNHWVVTLVAVGDSGYEKFGMRGYNCISNQSPNHTLQLTTFTTSVSESLCISKYDAFVVILSQMFSGHYICKIMIIIALSLTHAGVTSFKDAWSVMVWGSFLSGCLMLLAIHNHCLLSLSATMVANHSVVKTTNLFLHWYISVKYYCECIRWCWELLMLPLLLSCVYSLSHLVMSSQIKRTKPSSYILLQKQISCFNHRVITLITAQGEKWWSWLLETNCIKQSILSLSYNHNSYTENPQKD